MDHWLCIINQTNWQIVEKKKIWGVRDRYSDVIKQVRKGDSLVFYITGRSEVQGIYEVTGAYFESNEVIFETKGFEEDEAFRYRVRIREKIIPRKAIDFKTLVPVLDLFPQKHNWGMYLRGKAMIPLSERDYETIREKLARST